MRTRLKPPNRRAAWFLGSLWTAALVFLILRALVPA